MHPGRLFMENDAIVSSQDAGYDVDLLLCEHDNVAQNSRVSFKKKAIVGRHRLNGANISAAQTILWHTSLPVYGVDQDRRASYAKFFKPRSTFTSEVRRLSAPIGPYMGLHLRSDVRTWHRVAEWTLAEVVSLCARTCKRADINRVIIVSDLVDTTDVDEALQSVGIHARRATWSEQFDQAEQTFLDFLTLANAACIVSSGLSSFSHEASLFGNIDLHELGAEKAP